MTQFDKKIVDEVSRRNKGFFPSMTMWLEDDPRNSQKDRTINRLSVGEVIRQRMVDKNRDAKTVSLYPKQFSPWNDPKIAFDKIDKISPQNSAKVSWEWEKSKNTNYSGDATHFSNKDASSPVWGGDGKTTLVVGKKPYQHEFRSGINYSLPKRKEKTPTEKYTDSLKNRLRRAN